MRISDWSSDVCSSDLAATFSTILDLYRDARDLDWTMLSPAPVIAPGERTGHYRVGTDHPIGDTVSEEDFDVAIVGQLAHPEHTRSPFTVANSNGGGLGKLEPPPRPGKRHARQE